MDSYYYKDCTYSQGCNSFDSRTCPNGWSNYNCQIIRNLQLAKSVFISKKKFYGNSLYGKVLAGVCFGFQCGEKNTTMHSLFFDQKLV